MEGVFGGAGISSSCDIIAFNDAIDVFSKETLCKAPDAFRDYMEIIFLCNNVTTGQSGCTNNNCDSVNHVHKLYTQWRLQQLPELIDKLQDVVQSQYVEADRALCSRGDFLLAPSATRHRVTLEYWCTHSAKQRETGIILFSSGANSSQHDVD